MKKAVYWLRRFGPWIWFVSSIGAPVYRLLWEYIINTRGKTLHLKSEYRALRDNDLDKRGFKILRESEFLAFGKLLRSKISPALIEQERQRLLSTADDYCGDLFPMLDNDARTATLRFAVSPPVLRYVMAYLRVAPRMRWPNVLINIVRPELGEEGSKLWHRDAGYRCVTLFMCLSEVDDSSGPYFVIGKDQVPLHAEVPKAHIDPSLSVWKRYRLSDEEMFPYIDRSEIRKLAGDIGTTILVDSGACYHKGGYCKAKERLMLQIRYVTDDGEADLPGWASIVDLSHPEVAGLVSDPLYQYMIGRGDASLIRRLRLFRVLKMIYHRIMRYRARPKTKPPSVAEHPA